MIFFLFLGLSDGKRDKRSKIPGMFGIDAKRFEDGIRRGHKGGPLSRDASETKTQVRISLKPKKMSVNIYKYSMHTLRQDQSQHKCQ